MPNLHLALKERLMAFIATLGWRLFLLGSGVSEAELLSDLYDDAVREYKSDKENAWRNA